MQGGAGKLKRLIVGLIAACSVSAGTLRAEIGISVLSNLIWDLPEPWFGGFSGMEISPDGNDLTLITDRSDLVAVRIIREAGRITALVPVSRLPLRHANGQEMQGAVGDAEGLAIGPDGQAFVSFESRHRVDALDLSTGVTRRLPTHPDFEGFPKNGGLEALAIDAQGRLFTLAEDDPRTDGTFALYVLSDGGWEIAGRIPVSGPFLPVGADFDAQGRLYLLERTLTPLGFRSRVRRFDLQAAPIAQETLFTSLPGSFDNLEALSLWTDPAGTTRLVAISDDNFLPLQRTQVVEFALTE